MLPQCVVAKASEEVVVLMHQMRCHCQNLEAGRHVTPNSHEEDKERGAR